MNDRIWRIWRDPVFATVIGGLILAGILALVSGNHLLRTYSLPLWLLLLLALALLISFTVALGRSKRPSAKPSLTVASLRVPIPAAGKTLTYPVKIYVEVRNDSGECIDVRIQGFSDKKITLKRLVPNVLQVAFGKDWFPEPDGVDRVAVLPGQLFRLWLAVDDTQYTAAKVDAARGSIGTLSLTVSGTVLDFQL